MVPMSQKEFQRVKVVPDQAANRPFLKAAPLPIATMIAVEDIVPMPGCHRSSGDFVLASPLLDRRIGFVDPNLEEARLAAAADLAAQVHLTAWR
jgi:hypothetical protein